MKTEDSIRILNGSPRGKGSNSRLLIGYFVDGYARARRESIGVHYLKGMRPEQQREIFLTSDYLIVVLPLYTDAMPGLVKEFFENLAPLKGDHPSLRLGFIVHSGFPEAHHSVYLAQYLEKLTRRLGCQYLGTVIKGGTEGMKLMPDWFKKKTINLFTGLGREFALQSGFDARIMEQLRRPYQLSKKQVFLFRVFRFLNFGDIYWNTQLKKNGAFEQRYLRPYG